MTRRSLLPSPTSPWRSLPAATALIALLIVVIFAGFPALADPEPARAADTAGAESGLVLPEMADLSELSWTGAFAELHTKMSREYGFTSWKHIDWPALYAKYAPQVARAQWAHDEFAYYLTLCRYVHELRDGHATVIAATNEAAAVIADVYARLADGGFGLAAARLDNGHVVAAWVQPGGPAAKAGMKTGARLLRWRGRPIGAAVSRVDTVLSPCFSTDARLDRERLRFLTRARVGAHRTLTFRNRGAARHTVRLTAVSDDRITLTKTDERSTLAVGGWPQKTVEHRILTQDEQGRQIVPSVGYVKVRVELDLPDEVPGDHTPTLQLFREAISDFIAAGVGGVIVDLRGNSGGSDQMVADMMASFYDQPSFYEYATFFNTATGHFELWDSDETTGAFTQPATGVWIQPGAQRYTGPVVALVDNACVSSGEGLAMAVRRLPNGRTVGFYGTDGSFGMAGDSALMPGGFGVLWPFGCSLNQDKVIQLDSRPIRGGWRGGVATDLRVPATVHNLSQTLRGRDVVLEYGLRKLASMGQ